MNKLRSMWRRFDAWEVRMTTKYKVAGYVLLACICAACITGVVFKHIENEAKWAARDALEAEERLAERVEYQGYVRILQYYPETPKEVRIQVYGWPHWVAVSGPAELVEGREYIVVVDGNGNLVSVTQIK